MKRTRTPLFSLNVLCFILVVCSPINQAIAGPKLSSGIKAIMDKPVYKHADWGFLAVDLKTGEVLYSLDPGKFFCPGSTTKLFTLATALDTLGVDYRFKSPVYAQGEISSSGQLNGNLILVASGDLTMGGRATPEGEIAYTSADHNDANALGICQLTPQNPLAGIEDLARQVAKKGIREVQGEVIVDTRLFCENPAPSLELEYPLSPIIINDNLIDFTIQPQQSGSPARVDWRPKTTFFKVEARVNTVSAGQPLTVDIFSPQDHQIVVRGQVPEDSAQVIRTFQIPDPASFARALFIEALKNQSIQVTASVLSANPASLLPEAKSYPGFSKVAELVSPPFKEYVRLILKVSHNMGANIMPVLIALQNEKTTLEEGINCEQPFLQNAGVDTSLVSLGDGEGGVPSDMITPKAMVQLLRYMATRPDSAYYRRALPILGVDGTLAGAVGEDSPAYGKVFAKTGTTGKIDFLNLRLIIKGKALAGYLTDIKGRSVAFAVFVNMVPGPELTDDDAITGFMMTVGQDLAKITEAIYLGNN